MNPHKVLVGIPVYQNTAILSQFLASLKKLNRTEEYDQYQRLDPGTVCGSCEKYDVILDAAPSLIDRGTDEY